MENRYYCLAVFNTACVLYALSQFDSPVAGMVQRSLTQRSVAFLESRATEQALWAWDDSLPVDCDDSVFISFCLSLHGGERDNQEAINRFREASGLFRTYCRDQLEIERDVDSIVNANAILYLGEGGNAAIVEWLTSLVERDEPIEISSIYYPHGIFLASAIARITKHRAGSALSSLSPLLIDRILGYLDDPVFLDNDLYLSLAITSLVTLGCPDVKRVKNLMVRLRKRQRRDGGWDIHAFCTDPNRRIYWGSRELVTAFALEALMALDGETPAR